MKRQEVFDMLNDIINRISKPKSADCCVNDDDSFSVFVPTLPALMPPPVAINDEKMKEPKITLDPSELPLIISGSSDMLRPFQESFTEMRLKKSFLNVGAMPQIHNCLKNAKLRHQLREEDDVKLNQTVCDLQALNDEYNKN